MTKAQSVVVDSIKGRKQTELSDPWNFLSPGRCQILENW